MFHTTKRQRELKKLDEIHYRGNAKTGSVGLTTPVSNKFHSRPNNIKGDKECHFTIHRKDKIVMKIYLLNYRASKYIKLKMLEIKWEIYRNTFVWRECDIPLLLPLAGKRLKIRKYIDKLKKR